MTPSELKAIRKQMKLTQSQMAAWLHVSGDRLIRRWESGECKIPGNIVKCFELAGII